MNSMDKEAFEKRIETDVDLQEKVKFQAQLMDGIDKISAREELEEIHQRRYSNRKIWSKPGLWVGVASVVFLVGIFALWQQIPIENSGQKNINRSALSEESAQKLPIEIIDTANRTTEAIAVPQEGVGAKPEANSDEKLPGLRQVDDGQVAVVTSDEMPASSTDIEIISDLYQPVAYTLNAGKPYHLQLRSGVHIYFNANSFVHANGKPYAGQLIFNVQEHSYILKGEKPVVCDLKISVTDPSGTKLGLAEEKDILIGNAITTSAQKVSAKIYRQQLADTTSWKVVSPAAVPVPVRQDSLLASQAVQFTLMGKEARTNLGERYSVFKVNANSMKRAYQEIHDLSKRVKVCPLPK